MRFGRQDELESDQLGVRLAAEAGYDPRSISEAVLGGAGGTPHGATAAPERR